MRLGVLDVGSNSAQLQVVDAHGGAPPLATYAVKEPTLLGGAFAADGRIDPAGVDRVVRAVSAAMAAADRFGVDQLYAFVTSAIRDATNRAEIMDRLERESGLRPQLLTGEDEALLTYFAAHRWYGWRTGRLLLLDIGGGSMEIVRVGTPNPNSRCRCRWAPAGCAGPSCTTTRRCGTACTRG